MRTKPQYWPIAYVGGPHGVKGKIKVFSFSGELIHLTSFTKWKIGASAGSLREVRIQETTPFKDGLLVTLEGHERIEDVQAYKGWQIWLAREQFRPLEEGEVYQKDLMNCDLLLDGKVVGQVVEVVDYNGRTNVRLDLSSMGHDGTIEIPFCELYFGAFDSEKGTLELHHIEEFLEGMADT